MRLASGGLKDRRPAWRHRAADRPTNRPATMAARGTGEPCRTTGPISKDTSGQRERAAARETGAASRPESAGGSSIISRDYALSRRREGEQSMATIITDASLRHGREARMFRFSHSAPRASVSQRKIREPGDREEFLVPGALESQRNVRRPSAAFVSLSLPLSPSLPLLWSPFIARMT